VLTSNTFMLAMLGVLAGCTYALGPLAMINLYLVPYWINVSTQQSGLGVVPRFLLAGVY
jgi:hypothetical protein